MGRIENHWNEILILPFRFDAGRCDYHSGFNQSMCFFRLCLLHGKVTNNSERNAHNKMGAEYEKQHLFFAFASPPYKKLYPTKSHEIMRSWLLRHNRNHRSISILFYQHYAREHLIKSLECCGGFSILFFFFIRFTFALPPANVACFQSIKQFNGIDQNGLNAHQMA